MTYIKKKLIKFLIYKTLLNLHVQVSTENPTPASFSSNITPERT